MQHCHPFFLILIFNDKNVFRDAAPISTRSDRVNMHIEGVGRGPSAADICWVKLQAWELKAYTQALKEENYSAKVNSMFHHLSFESN